jgi:hypothetical protein
MPSFLQFALQWSDTHPAPKKRPVAIETTAHETEIPFQERTIVAESVKKGSSALSVQAGGGKLDTFDTLKR